MFDGLHDLDVPDILPLKSAPVALRAGHGEVLVELTRSYSVLLDQEDVALMQGRRFYAHQGRSNVYARNRELGFLHQLICAAQPGWVVDHINRISLDCRRNNLRIAGYDANANNASYANSTTGFRGVQKVARKGRDSFRARIFSGGDNRHLGYYDNPEDAARAYDDAALTLYGKHAWTNFHRNLTPERAAPVDELPF